MNRVLQFLPCRCELKRRRLAVAQAACDRNTALAGDVIDTTCRPLSDDDDHRLHFWISVEIEPTDDCDGANLHPACELRHIIDELSGAVERLEGGAT